jgi:CMP-N-acetylneuraminic acid synthetase
MRIALITARGGSQGLPRKNVIGLLGIPLIAWTIKAALRSKSIDKVYVSSEDEEILEVSKAYGANLIERPLELSRDDTPSAPVISHAIEFLKTIYGNFETLLLLQPTSPLRTEVHIDESFELYESKTNGSTVISCSTPDICIPKCFKASEDGTMLPIFGDDSSYKRRQDLSEFFYPNGAIYIFSRKDFEDSNLIPSKRIYPYIMANDVSIDIDDLNDLIKCERFMESNGYEQ